MRRVVCLITLLGVSAGCSQYAAITKRPEEFAKLCESVVGSDPVPASMDAVEAAKLKPRLIAPGMQISVSVVEDISLNRTYVVPPGCILEIAAAGRFDVCGLTPDELAKKIREPLERDYFQRATVSVFIESAASPTAAGGVVYLLGDVNRPGPMLLPRDQVFTLTKAIIAAGGFSQFAKGNAVRVLRYCDDGKKYDTFVNVERIMRKGEFERDIPLQPNDWVIVDRKIVSF